MPIEKKIMDFYIKCENLDDVIVNGKSVPEHIFNAIMIAVAINSEFEYKYDISKIIEMISFGITAKFVDDEFFKNDKIHSIINNFNNQVSNESNFAKQCFELEMALCNNNSKNLSEDFKYIYDSFNKNDDERINNIKSFIEIGDKLKNITRKGWIDWCVKRDRIENDAEHVYGVIMLAASMLINYNYSLDFDKVILLAALHEIGEAKIGDLTQFDIGKQEKKIIEHAAVHEILCNINDGSKLEELYLEFDERSSDEGMFTHLIDKFQCDLKCKKYDEEGCVDLDYQPGNKTLDVDIVKQLLDELHSWSKMWLRFGQIMYNYDDNIMAVSDYAFNHSFYNEDKKKVVR